MSTIPPEENADEVWDEFRWEQFMQEQDRKVDRLIELMKKYMDDPNRDEIIEREMGWSVPPGEAENDLDFLGQEFFDEDEEEDGEGWKSAAGVEDEGEELELHAFRKLPAFQKANDFGLRAFDFVEKLPEHIREDSDVVDFISNAMIAAAKLAGGASFDEDANLLGGSIAYCKRGLNASNNSIEALQAMKRRKIIDEASYLSLFEDAKEVRDLIAVYIVELREKFRRGV